MKKKEINWGKLDFGYTRTDWRFIARYRGGAWDAGELSAQAELTLNESACVLQYAQTCFEGLKAYTTADGRTVCFRPDLNAERMAQSCRRLAMPVFPEERFLDAVRQVIRANGAWVPPHGSGASLYLRPVMYGIDPVLGVKPSRDFDLRIFASPVGPYFRGGVRPLVLRVSDYDRAAPRGTGSVKVGLNYAMSLYAITEAHAQGYDENVYLDPATRTYVEETGGANLIFLKGNTLVTPKSDSILPSITRRSLVDVARAYLGMTVEERPIAISEIGEFDECGLCGTAAVISPVGKIVDHGSETVFSAEPAGIARLYDTLTGIQMGCIPAPAGWLMEIG